MCVTECGVLYWDFNRKQRVAHVEIAKKEKQKKRLANISGGRHAALNEKKEKETKGRKGPVRASAVNAAACVDWTSILTTVVFVLYI